MDLMFESWFSELTKIAQSKGFASAGLKSEWRKDYEAGLSPIEAWNGGWDFY
ncbi:hypothetical protein PEC106568_07270 [Pectobacterium carotovorum subsp. carotovorum]|nr:hypothetical protein PEC106568_07270 [Pectobacterium carotovorum subsp. carotovorum]